MVATHDPNKMLEEASSQIDELVVENERLRSSYGLLVAQAEDIKEQYRDCSSELAAERRHHAHLQETCDALSTNVVRLTEETEQNRYNGQLMFLEQQRWQGMAEDLWEELQEWHAPDCPTQPMSPVRFRADGCVDSRKECTCHRILAAKWDELTHAAEYADDGFDDITEPPRSSL